MAFSVSDLLFDLGEQLDLRPAAIQVVPRTVRLVIGVAVQIVAQEANRLLVGDEPGAENQVIDLDWRQDVTGRVQETVRNVLEQRAGPAARERDPAHPQRR